MSSSIEPRVLVSICETNLNDQFEPSFRDNRDRNSQQETASLPTRWNKTKKQNRDASRVVCKTFREDMSYPASARNIPNNNIRLPRAFWQDDDVNITCHQTDMPIQPRQVMSPNPHSLGMQRHVSERTDRHSLIWRPVNQQKRWRRSTASQISVATLLHRLESVERQNEEMRQRISEMDRSNPSSIHGTETTSYPTGPLSENDTSNQRESDQISEPVARPENRRMTPSDDVEAEIDDLHRWYTMRASEIEENRSIELAQSSASSVQKIDEMSVANHSGSSNDSGSTFDPRDSAAEKIGNGKIDAKSDTQTKLLGENESNDAIFSPKLPQNSALMNFSGRGESSTSNSNSQAEGENSQNEVKIGNQSNCNPESDNLQVELAQFRPVTAQNQRRTVLSNICVTVR